MNAIGSIFFMIGYFKSWQTTREIQKKDG